MPPRKLLPVCSLFLLPVLALAATLSLTHATLKELP